MRPIGPCDNGEGEWTDGVQTQSARSRRGRGGRHRLRPQWLWRHERVYVCQHLSLCAHRARLGESQLSAAVPRHCFGHWTRGPGRLSHSRACTTWDGAVPQGGHSGPLGAPPATVPGQALSCSRAVRPCHSRPASITRASCVTSGLGSRTNQPATGSGTGQASGDGKLLKDMNRGLLGSWRTGQTVEMQAQLKDPKVKQLPVPESSMAVKECYLSVPGVAGGPVTSGHFQKLLDVFMSLVALSVFEVHNKDNRASSSPCRSACGRQVAMTRSSSARRVVTRAVSQGPVRRLQGSARPSPG